MQTLQDKVATTQSVSFGNGRYSAQMASFYDAMQKVFGIKPSTAEKIARQAGSDMGAIFANVEAKVTIGKINSDGKATFADASKVKGITISNPLHIARALQWIGDAGKNGISYGFTEWRLSEELEKYVNSFDKPKTDTV